MRHRQRHVPVTMGSPRFRTLEATGCTIIDAWFPAGAYLPPHTHDRPIFGVMLSGAFDSEIASRTLDCPPASAWVEPLGERHANRIGREGAHVLVVQPDLSAFEELSAFLGAVQHLRQGAVAADAWRLAAELDHVDELSPLIADGLVHTMLGMAARQQQISRFHVSPPRWLLLAQEFVHVHFRDRISLASVAGAVSVTPSHLAREFRVHFGTTVGEYIRQRRVEWVAEQLTQRATTLSEVGIAAGFSDQSHLTREFRGRLGMTPGEWRRRHRPE